MGRSGPHLARFATGSPNGTQPHEPSIPLAINEHVIRWSEIRLPHPSRKGELIPWKVDGPFSLRSYYEVEDSGGRIELDLSHRKEDGTIERCLHCGSAELKGRMEASRASILMGLLWLALAAGLAPWTYGLSVAVAAYPLWFLWTNASRVQKCTSCGAEFVDFRMGPRP